MAKVSLYIPVRNGANFIGECIQSIVGQTFADWSLTVSDNQSSDETETIVESFNDSRIAFCRQPHDVGMIANFNSCIERCNSTYYAILSHDDKFHSREALQDAVALLDAREDVAIVYSNMIWIDAHSKPIANLTLPARNLVSSDAVAKQSFLSCRNLFGVPVLLRREVVGHNRYDPRFPHTADIDFSLAVGKGRSVFILDRPCVAIRFHRENGTMRNFDGILRELLMVASKHGIYLSLAERVRMFMSDRVTRVKKRIFFLYLDYRKAWQ